MESKYKLDSSLNLLEKREISNRFGARLAGTSPVHQRNNGYDFDQEEQKVSMYAYEDALRNFHQDERRLNLMTGVMTALLAKT